MSSASLPAAIAPLDAGAGTAPTLADRKRASLLWAMLHVPLILLLYLPAMGAALDGIPPLTRAALITLYAIEAAVTAGVAWCLALPFVFLPRVFRRVAPLLTALLIVILVVDSRLYAALSFHMNALFFRAILQPHVIQEVGLTTTDVALVSGAFAAWTAFSLWAGGRFLDRVRGERPIRVWRWLLLLVVLEATDRVALASLNFFGGPAVFAAGQVLPLQVRFTMSRLLSKWTGRPMMRDPLEVAARSSRAHLPAGVAPSAVHLTSKPDIVLVLIESTRADFLDSLTMPNLWRRSHQGARFLREYSAATSTHYSVFSLFYALQPQKLEAVVGEGRPPLLFGVLKEHGYQARLVAASSVDWMGLRKTVFGAVERDLEADVPGRDGSERDANMVTRMRQFVAAADADRPLFAFLFFDGTHFNYSFPRDAERFTPEWDGSGTIEAAHVAPQLLENRARNAAWEIDRKLEAFLRWYEQARGRRPLLIVTGDHGEEYREHGRVGHGTGVTEEQVHVPLVVTGPGVPVGEVGKVTSSIDIVPTIFALLGDTLSPARYSDGEPLFAPSDGRFVLASVGWEPVFAVLGDSLKVSFSTYDAGLGSFHITDPEDRPLADGSVRFAHFAPRIMRAFSGVAP